MEAVTGVIGSADGIEERCTKELGTTSLDGSGTVEGAGTTELVPTGESPGILRGKHLEKRGLVMPCARNWSVMKLGLIDVQLTKSFLVNVGVLSDPMLASTPKSTSTVMSLVRLMPVFEAPTS